LTTVLSGANPAGQAPQADPGQLLAGVVQLAGEPRDLVPGGLGGHRQPGLVEQVLAVHQERRLAVERDRVEAVVVGQRVGDRGDQVGGVVVGGLLGVGPEVLDPAVLGPLGRLEGADGDHVVLAALGGDVLGHPVAQLVLGQDHEVDLDVRVVLLEELGGQLLDVLHLGVGDRGHGDGRLPPFGVTAAATTPGAGAGAGGQGEDEQQDPGNANSHRSTSRVEHSLYRSRLSTVVEVCSFEHDPARLL
jgi:hypothetical protein